jgi:hypothetical protein
MKVLEVLLVSGLFRVPANALVLSRQGTISMIQNVNSDASLCPRQLLIAPISRAKHRDCCRAAVFHATFMNFLLFFTTSSLFDSGVHEKQLQEPM